MEKRIPLKEKRSRTELKIVRPKPRAVPVKEAMSELMRWSGLSTRPSACIR
jgi:hypothetical protein